MRLSGDGAATLSDLRASSTLAISAALDELGADERAELASALPVLERLAELLTAGPPD